ncbi:hypothetical protein [Acinetobacter sp.]|uniref:hypothetical protein n=1 Tax=Acinetobacter sp. TaxID=472 RepID=UPI00388FCB87
MHFTFRQGIARYQTDISATPSFLQKSSQSGDFIDLVVSPDPTIVVFAHKGSTYVLEESRTVSRAWGPFSGNSTCYLYWDISLLDATVTRGFTTLPQIVSSIPPSNPATDQHWFDTNAHQMKVWNNGKWSDKIRVFAAKYSSQAIIQGFPIGTQAGENGSFEGGSILRDSFGKPLRQSDGTFLTTVSSISVVNTPTQPIKLAAEILIGMAEENIPKFSLVQTKSKALSLAKSIDHNSRVIGIVTEDLYRNEVGNVQTFGIVRNDQWNWATKNFGKPIFCGPTGEISLSAPTVGVSQVVGYIYDVNSIFINIQPAIILDEVSSSGRRLVSWVPELGEFAVTEITQDFDVHSGVLGYQHNQPIPSKIWQITHAQNTKHVHISIWDEDGSLIFPDAVKINDSNTVMVKFSKAIAGQAILMLF